MAKIKLVEVGYVVSLITKMVYKGREISLEDRFFHDRCIIGFSLGIFPGAKEFLKGKNGKYFGSKALFD
ncbi:MAG: hypothetical protein MJ202_08855 [Lentisphaeria bacterium]|nr:hypothetical protein [Lentisphaeria bacterium]